MREKQFSELRAMMTSQLGDLEARLVADSELITISRLIGLHGIHPDASTFDFGSLISESQSLAMVLNDGRTWLSVHRDRLRRRFQDPRKETTVILTHPDSPMVAVLARKANTEGDAIRAKLEESVALLMEIRSDTTVIEVLGHFLFNPHAVFVGDDRAYVTPYFTSRGGRTVPVFEYIDAGPDSMFRSLREDVEGLRIDCASLVASDGFEKGVARLHTL
jgi:hypothetical protein